MKKGDRVLLNPESPFNDGDVENPSNIEGVVVDIDPTEKLCITVCWYNGHSNGYSESDLILINQPSFDRTAIATQILSGMMPQRTTKDIIQRKDEIVKQAIELTDELIKQLSE